MLNHLTDVLIGYTDAGYTLYDSSSTKDFYLHKIFDESKRIIK